MTVESKAYELFFGVISPVGVEQTAAIEALRAQLEDKKYTVHVIKLSDLIKKAMEVTEVSCESARINGLMDAGNDFRASAKRGDAVALLGLFQIRQIREDFKILKDRKYLREKHAYIFDSLKHADEVESLRKIYQNRFFAISIYSPKSKRLETLETRIKKSRKGVFMHDKQEIANSANDLFDRDKSEPDNTYGQNIRETFHLADLFVTDAQAKAQIKRFIDLLFGARFITPTLDEYGMFMAHSVALLSADLSRQVGAVILRKNGEVIATGCNEVPLPAGEFYWPDTSNSENDFREYKLGTDANTDKKHDIIDELLNRLKKHGWLKEEIKEKDNNYLINDCLYQDKKLLKGTRLASLIEFGRIIHAEMAAITTAARLGISTKGANLYCTTFPCHGCARHIISSGIEKVYYIEPYPKSLTSDLYKDMVNVEGESNNTRHKTPLEFKPYIGIAPRNYYALFTALERKGRDGRAYSEKHRDDLPKIPHVSSDYDEWEVIFSRKVSSLIGDKTKH